MRKKLLEFILSAVITVIAEFVLLQLGVLNSITTAFTSNDNKIFTFLTYPVPLWNVIAFVLLMILIYVLIQKIILSKTQNVKTKDMILYERQDEFKTQHRFMSIPDNNTVTFKTDFYFSGGNIIINNIEPYCVLHDIRVKMYSENNTPRYKCSKHPCQTGFIMVPEHVNLVKAQIVSDLEHEWESWD